MGVDFMATFVQGVAGGTVPANHDGRDFSKTWLAGGDPEYVSDAAWPRTYAFVEAADLVGDPPEYRGIFNSNNTTYYRYPQTRENEFYDLDEDPGQLNDSALQNQGRVDKLRTAATRMANCSADTCRQYDH